MSVLFNAHLCLCVSIASVMAESDGTGESPCAKRRKANYKLCGHCDKELSMKIFKEHRRLYYDSANKSWIRDGNDDDISSSHFSSLEEYEFRVAETTATNIHVPYGDQSSDSESSWEGHLDFSTTNQGIIMSPCMALQV